MASKNKNSSSAIEKLNIELGKLPPQSNELEEAVLGAIMIEKTAIHSVADVLTAESFYNPTHQTIFLSVMDLFKDTNPVDLLTVTENLKSKGKLEEVGGATYIAQLTSKVASATHLEFHAKIIVQKHIQRKLIEISSEIQRRSYADDEDVNDLINYSESAIFEVAEGTIKSEAKKIDSIIDDALKQIKEAGKREDGLSGVPSGFTAMDRVTSGWQQSDLVIIAARPAMGKTAFVLTMARNIAVDHKRPVAFFSLEMSNEQLVKRLIVSETQIDSKKIKTGKLRDDEWIELETKIQKLIEAPIFIDDTPAINVFELRAKCRRLKAQYNIEIVVIDYLQLMSGDSMNKGNREQEISMISRSLKALAKELNIPIIALSQLSRAVELRGGNKRPQLSDLRESGAIEQDADMVLFIHRPEYYQNEDEDAEKGLAQIIIAKHRNGEVTDIDLTFKPEFAQFVEREDFDFNALDSDPQTMTISSKMNKEENMELPSDFLNTNFDDQGDMPGF